MNSSIIIFYAYIYDQIEVKYNSFRITVQKLIIGLQTVKTLGDIVCIYIYIYTLNCYRFSWILNHYFDKLI